ncbi:putative oxidoreductase [uncultured delta proteobacterium]|uniref:Putative oxidoreductase n=1 Tax=uncultured delta proteobacterium TaxID=34034 RepID=A0A212JK90_9DELT|nr:putative oxidoreductase [uncultured delta proteobacterium]
MAEQSKIWIDGGVLKQYATDLLVRRNIAPADAAVTVDNLIFADLRGIDTHGVMRLALYLERIDRGLLAAENRVAIVRENDGMVVVDGGNYLGPVAATLAMEKAVAKAKNGVAGLGFVRNNHHYGSCAYYAMMALPHDMIGFSCSNTTPLMAPTGGARRLVGNNPFAFAAPAGKYRPFVLDIALSVVAGGKILLAEKNGQKIPYGWALDKNGQPTDDPRAGFSDGGLLLPIGGHKGYGMAVMVDILAGVLAGSAFGTEVQGLADFASTKPLGTGHCMVALNVEAILGIRAFKDRMDALIEEIKSVPLAEGVERVYVPGEIEFEVHEKRSREGVPVSPKVVAELEALGASVGLPPVEKRSGPV